MGYAEDQQKMISERAYGRQGINTGSGHPENQRSLEEHHARQRAEKRNSDLIESVSSSSSNTWSPRSSSSTSGGGLSILLALGMLYGFFAAAGHIEQYTGSYESAMIVVGVLFVVGMLCLWLLWKLMIRFLVGFFDVLEVVWDNKIGKLCISTAMIVAGFYGANELYGDRGVALFGQLLLGSVIIWGVYAGLKWFCSTLVGKILLRTTVIGGLIGMAWYLYTGHIP